MTAAIVFNQGFSRVIEHGFTTGIFEKENEAIAYRDKRNERKTNHPDYSLVYPSQDGTGMPVVKEHKI